MKISKRTIIIFVIGVLAVAAALVSLYLEKQSEIDELLEVDEPAPVRRTREPKPKPEPEHEAEVINIAEAVNNGQ